MDEKKLKYPKSVFFIIGNEFCERFAYYGMRAVLSFYLAKYLMFQESEATVVFHSFAALCYLSPLFGAYLADSILGKFKTIFYLSLVYVVGNVVLSLGSIEQLGLPATAFTMIGLLLIAIGTGGIKPCVVSFGADQFLPQQVVELATFFSTFYFMINAGSLLSSVLTPIFREDISCSGTDLDGQSQGCYPLAFGVPAVLMIVSLIIFLIGKPFYRNNPPEGNIVAKVASCIGHAVSQKRKSSLRRQHWLEHADDKYDKGLIDDIKGVLRVLVLYIPIPAFWALYDQQGSTWTFQASRMNGYTPIYTIKPDQFQVINALLILVFIPLFDKIIYPLLASYKLLTKPLQRLTAGGILTGVAFLVSALLELKLETTYPLLPKTGESSLHFINTLPCNINIMLDERIPPQVILSNQNYIFEQIPSKNYTVDFNLIENQEDFQCKSFLDSLPTTNTNSFNYKKNITPEDSKITTALILMNKNKGIIDLIMPNSGEDLVKAEAGKSKIRAIYHGLPKSWNNVVVHVTSKNGGVPEYLLSIMTNETEKVNSGVQIVEALEYTVTLAYSVGNGSEENTMTLGDIGVEGGGNYVISIAKNYSSIESSANNDQYSLGLQTYIKPNSVHMLWLLPQYIIITAGEIMFSITGLEFSYAEAPPTMKAVVQAAWLLNVFFGNIIVVIWHALHFFEKVSDNLFLFTGLMFIDMLIFALIAYWYKPRENLETIQVSSPGMVMPLEANTNQNFPESNSHNSSISKNHHQLSNNGAVNGMPPVHGIEDYDHDHEMDQQPQHQQMHQRHPHGPIGHGQPNEGFDDETF